MSYIIRVLRGRWCHIIVLNETVDVKDISYEELKRVFHNFPKYHNKFLLGDFNVKVGREDIFKPRIGNEILHEIGNDNAVRVVKFVTSRNITVKSTMFPHRNIHKYTWTSQAGKPHNQIDHILVERRRHSNALDVRSFRAADCDSDHYLGVVKVRKRLAVNKQIPQRSRKEKFNIKNLNEVRGQGKYCIEVSNRFAALEDLNAEEEFNSAWETTREIITISAKKTAGYELRKHKPWFDEGCSQLLDQTKQAKLHWLQDPSEINVDNLNNVKREASRHFRNEKGNK
jgi:hypothetical protein